MAQNILIFGATGAIGSYLTQALLDNKSSFGKIDVVTYPESYKNKKELFQKLKDQGAEVSVIDFEDENAIADLYKGTVVDPGISYFANILSQDMMPSSVHSVATQFKNKSP
jgi:nucleoside-diphosphate-sugar epimerase